LWLLDESNYVCHVYLIAGGIKGRKLNRHVFPIVRSCEF
jgi:hypothetical protein